MRCCGCPACQRRPDMAVSMHCFATTTARVSKLTRWLIGIALLALAQIAAAHKASDSYLQLAVAPDELRLRWDIALRDLDVDRKSTRLNSSHRCISYAVF